MIGATTPREPGAPAIARVVALGASNLTRGFQTVVATSRSTWGPRVEVLSAHGHGRSYGASSRFWMRSLPGILQSGLWRQLDALPPAPTRALVTDVGNDILYGFTAGQVLAWVDEAIARLQRITTDITLTGLPLAGIATLTPGRFLAVRSLVVPWCRLSLTHVRDTAERVHDGLVTLAARRRVAFFALEPSWYGVDPIHIRPSRWRSAWQAMLVGRSDRAAGARSTAAEGLRLYFLPPERRWLFGREQVTPQAGIPLRAGGRVWLF